MKSSVDIRRVLGLLLGLVACGFLAIVERWYVLYGVMFVLALPMAGHVHGHWERRSLEALPLAWFLVLVALGSPLFALLAQAMLVAMACRFALTENARDYQGLVSIGVFITVLSAAGSISVGFGLLLLAEFLVATMLLIMAQFDGKVPHIARGFYSTMIAFSLLSFIFAFGVFFALPRWTLGYIKGNAALVTQTTGFSKDVTISPGQAQQDGTVIMRIEPRKGEPRLPLPLYISGMRYTTFTGRQWLVAAGRPESLYPSSGIDTFVVSDGQPIISTTAYVEPTGTDVIFGLEHITGLRGQFQFLRRDADGNLFTDPPYYKTIRYDVASLDQDTVPVDSAVAHRPALLDRYLQVPELSPAFRDVAARVVRGTTMRDWRVLAGLSAAMVLGFLFLRRCGEARRNPLIAALENLAGEPRRPGETLLELVRRVAPSSDLEGLVWHIYNFLFSGKETAEEEKALLRLLHDARRAHSGARRQL